MTTETLVIVFGAGGRLGARLLPRLTIKPISVLGIARQNKPVTWPSGMHWMQVDVTNPDEWPRSLGALVGIAGVHQRVIVVDLLLRRATVAAMRDSIAAITGYVLRLRDRLAAADLSCSLIAASTTAVLAPWLYQTPYGLAKRRQLARYAASGVPGAAFLLPSLAETPKEASAKPGVVWTYDQAAEQLALTIGSQATSPDRRLFRLMIPPVPARLPGRSDKHGDLARVLAKSIHTHTRLIVDQRDSPYAHREASHHRIALTPRRLRRQIDHHDIPPHLVRRFARRLGTLTETASC